MPIDPRTLRYYVSGAASDGDQSSVTIAVDTLFNDKQATQNFCAVHEFVVWFIDHARECISVGCVEGLFLDILDMVDADLYEKYTDAVRKSVDLAYYHLHARGFELDMDKIIVDEDQESPSQDLSPEEAIISAVLGGIKHKLENALRQFTVTGSVSMRNSKGGHYNYVFPSVIQHKRPVLFSVGEVNNLAPPDTSWMTTTEDSPAIVHRKIFIKRTVVV